MEPSEQRTLALIFGVSGFVVLALIVAGLIIYYNSSDSGDGTDKSKSLLDAYKKENLDLRERNKFLIGNNDVAWTDSENAHREIAELKNEKWIRNVQSPLSFKSFFKTNEPRETHRPSVNRAPSPGRPST